jgi:MFS family permease
MNYMKKRNGSVMTFLAFWLFMLLFKFGGGLHYAMNSPLGERLLPLWTVGLLMSIAAATQMILDVPAGKILDRFGYKNMLVFGTVIFLISILILYFTTTALLFIISIMLSSFGWLFFGPGRNAYVLSNAPKKEAGKFMDMRDIFGSIGIVLSAIALPFVVNLPFKLVSAIIFVILSLSLVSIISSPKDKRRTVYEDNLHERTHHQRRHLFLNFPSAIRRLNPASSFLILLNFAGALFYGTVWFVIPLIIASNTANSTLLGIGLGMFDFAVIIIGVFLYNLVDNANKKGMIFFGLTIFSLSSMLLGFNYGILFLVFAFLSTAGDEIATLPLWAWLHKLDSQHNQDGLVSGIINFAEDAGWAIGPLLAGILFATVGSKITLLISAVPLLILLLIYYFVVKKHAINISLLGAPKKPHKRRHKE